VTNILSAEEIAYLAQNANAATRGTTERGFSSTRTHRGTREDAVAVAVALAESGGDADAHNPVPPDNSYGLWQINMIGQMGEDRRKQFGLDSNERLKNPAINADAAFQVFLDAGRKFTPWSVYLSGSYLAHLPTALKAVGAPKQPGKYPGGTLPDSILPDPLQGISDFLGFITDSENWKRVGLFVAGGIAIIVGVMLWAKESPTVRQAAGTAVTVATRGKL
jgi:hypothetical protein